MAVDKLFDLGQQHDVPVGASFAPSGWYAPFNAAIVYAVGYVTTDLATLAEDLDNDLTDTNALTVIADGNEETFRERLTKEGSLFDDHDVAQTGTFKYYFFDQERARILCELVNVEEPIGFPRRPEVRWRVETPVSDVVSLTDDAKEKFTRDLLRWEVELKAMQKNSPNWFNWHGLVLPCMVAAYANLMGWKTPGFDISELVLPEDEVIVTDKFQLEMIGNTDIGLETSKLFIRRKALWAALGEDDVKVSNPDDTESGQLKEALAVAVSNWNSPVYARVLQVPSPKVDDVWDGESGRRRNRISVLTEFFRSEKAAQKAYEAEVEAREGEYVSKPASATTPSDDDEGYENIPFAWAEIPKDWLDAVRELKAEIGKKPKPVLKKTLDGMSERLKEEYMVTPEDVLQAWDSV